MAKISGKERQVVHMSAYEITMVILTAIGVIIALDNMK